MKKRRILAAYMALLLTFTIYTVLDTFVITRVYGDALNGSSEEYSGESSGDNGDQLSQNDSGTYGESESGNLQSGGGAQSGSSQQSGEQSGEQSGGVQGSGHSHRHKHGSRHNSGSSANGPSGKNGTSQASPGSGSLGSGSSDQNGTSSGQASSGQTSSSGSGTSSANTYSDSNIKVTLKEYRQYDTTIYVADVTVSSPEYLRTALAQGAYGRNVTEKTSEIASGVNAILAINGDYYGSQEKGYVIRNGKLYRSTAASGNEDLVIYKDGSFDIISEDSVTAEQLIAKGAVQTLSFGPALVENGKVAVSENEEVGKAMASNPRTAIGIIDDCHYVFVVSDGRTDESSGLSLYQLAQFTESLGAETVYNLDGGGSSTMYFKGNVVNNPTSGGSIKERSVSDIVYIGY